MVVNKNRWVLLVFSCEKTSDGFRRRPFGCLVDFLEGLNNEKEIVWSLVIVYSAWVHL